MTTTATATVSPSRIMEVGMAFWPSKVLLSAIELGVFTELGTRALTGAELQAALQLHPRANPDFFDTLVALRFLERDGDGRRLRSRSHADAPASPKHGPQPSPQPVVMRTYTTAFIHMTEWETLA